MKWYQNTKQYMYILFMNAHLDFRGKGSGNRNASRDESVETGDESVETRDESEAGEKTQQSCYNGLSKLPWLSVCLYPADTWRWNNVIVTSKRRCFDVIMTLLRCVPVR